MSNVDDAKVYHLIRIATESLQYPSAMKNIHQWAINELAEIEKQLGDEKKPPKPAAAPAASTYSRTPVTEKGKA